MMQWDDCKVIKLLALMWATSHQVSQLAVNNDQDILKLDVSLEDRDIVKLVKLSISLYVNLL